MSLLACLSPHNHSTIMLRCLEWSGNYLHCAPSMAEPSGQWQPFAFYHPKCLEDLFVLWLDFLTIHCAQNCCYQDQFLVFLEEEFVIFQPDKYLFWFGKVFWGDFHYNSDRLTCILYCRNRVIPVYYVYTCMQCIYSFMYTVLNKHSMVYSVHYICLSTVWVLCTYHYIISYICTGYVINITYTFEYPLMKTKVIQILVIIIMGLVCFYIQYNM